MKTKLSRNHSKIDSSFSYFVMFLICLLAAVLFLFGKLNGTRASGRMTHALSDIPVTSRMKFKLIILNKRNNKSLFSQHSGKFMENRKTEPTQPNIQTHFFRLYSDNVQWIRIHMIQDDKEQKKRKGAHFFC